MKRKNNQVLLNRFVCYMLAFNLVFISINFQFLEEVKAEGNEKEEVSEEEHLEGVIDKDSFERVELRTETRSCKGFYIWVWETLFRKRLR